MAAFFTERHGDFHVLRDDLIPGGSKRRALDLMLRDILKAEIAYAGTVFGHGALALTHSCRLHGKQARLFISSNDAGHPMLAALAAAGANIEFAGPRPIDELHAMAQEWAEAKDGACLPPGFDCPAFTGAMSAALAQFDVSSYPEIWTVSVSGTFARALRAAFPGDVVRTVSVAGEPGDHRAPEKYHRPALHPPRWPACPYTDAKLWRFAKDHAPPGALIWNIAG